jgi:hypothetical protein
MVLFALTVLAIVACCAIFVFSNRGGDDTNTKIHDASLGEDYEALLRRAKALTDKYKELTGGADLPSDLALSTAIGQIPTHTNPSISQQATAVISPKIAAAAGDAEAGTAADLVIGMAQDTDAKNFVSPPLLLMVLDVLDACSVTFHVGLIRCFLLHVCRRSSANLCAGEHSSDSGVPTGCCTVLLSA